MFNNNPLDYPEIRRRMTLFVSVKDALSCIRVSKTFSQDFAYPIWHTIDLKTQKTFVQLDSTVLNKYSHHIRVVKGIENQEHLDSLLSLRSTRLSELEIKTAMDPLFQANLYDFVRQNRATLIRLEIRRKSIRREPHLFVSLDSLTSMADLPQSSRLTTLSIRWLTLTRNSLTSVLRSCQALVTVDLCGTTIIPSQNFDDYQHTGVEELQVFMVDVIKGENPPLFVHFPNLERWKTIDLSDPSEFPSQVVKDSISKWCPKLRDLETNDTPVPLIRHLLVSVFDGLTRLTFNYKCISSDMILALLRCPINWERLATYINREGFYEEFEEDGVAEVQDHFQSSSWMLQSVLRCCQKLTLFDFPYHEMDMDEVERAPWACRDLENIKVRIKGLDTREKIERTLAKWREGRMQKKLGTTARTPKSMDWEDGSIEARTVRRLLQFDKLRSVWLGSKIWTL